MSTLLCRLGRWCFHRRRRVALLWIALLAAAGACAATLSGPTSNSFTVPGTEAQRAIDLMQQRFPQAAADGAAATVVLVAPEGGQLSDHRVTIAGIRDRLSAEPQVAAVEEENIAPDGRTGAMAVAYDVAAGELTDGDRAALLAAAQSARDAGLIAEVSGDALSTEDEGAGEGIGIVVAAVVLFVTLGSLLAAGLPLLVAAAALTVGVCAVTAASGFVDLNSDTSALALMLGIAVAIDYSLFIIFRYRQLATDGHASEEAAGYAVGRAGSAVLFAGLTVIIALAGLSVVGILALTQVGLAAAFTVAMAVVAALTLLPALLGFAGARVLRRRERDRRAGGAFRVPRGTRWAIFVVAHRIPVLFGAAAMLLIAAVPALDLRLGFPDDGTAPPASTQRKAYELLAAGFGPGFNGPLTIVVDAGRAGAAAPSAEQVSEIVRNIGVEGVAPPVFDESATTALLSVIPDTGPTTAETEHLIGEIRKQTGQFTSEFGVRVAVTGQTAIDIDSSAKLRAALIPYLAIVGGLAFVLLILVFRSLLIPLVAAAGFLLSVAATFGVVVAVFQWGWLNEQLGVDSSGVIVNLLPVVLIGMVFGLAMDYQVFLVTRMREEHLRGARTDAAIIDGFTSTARVVTAAAIIMISVFAGFLFSAAPMVQSFGFALAASVFFDAFIVRMTIVPAFMSLLGRTGWWLPGWLDRVLPDLDVEGRRLDVDIAELPVPQVR